MPIHKHAYAMMDERWDGRSNSFGNSHSGIYFGNSNLKRSFRIATWNIRGLLKKIPEITTTLEKKKVDICGLQETKCDLIDEENGE